MVVISLAIITTENLLLSVLALVSYYTLKWWHYNLSATHTFMYRWIKCHSMIKLWPRSHLTALLFLSWDLICVTWLQPLSAKPLVLSGAQCSTVRVHWVNCFQPSLSLCSRPVQAGCLDSCLPNNRTVTGLLSHLARCQLPYGYI